MATETQCASVMNWWCWDDKCPTFIKLSILWKTCSPQPCTRLLRLNFCKKERERFKCMTTLNRNQKKKKKLIWSIHNQIFEWKHSTFLCSSLLSAGYLDFSTWRFSVMFETAVLSGHPTQSELVPYPCPLSLNGPLDATCQMANTIEGILTPSRGPRVVSHRTVSELGV